MKCNIYEKITYMSNILQHILQYNRLAHVFRDIEYVVKNPVACSKLLSGDRDRGTVSNIYYYMCVYCMYVCILYSVCIH